MANSTPARRLSRLQPFYNDFFRPFSDFFSDDSWPFETKSTMPAVNIEEGKDSFLLTMAAPGMAKEDFKIDIEGNVLTVCSEKESKSEGKDRDFTRREYSYSSFSRSFTLPDDVDKGLIDASYTDGILKLKLPKKEEVMRKSVSKHIDVK
jgi:HSP20 family protein